jgi:NADPH-dependent curcumin reductase CurA
LSKNRQIFIKDVPQAEVAENHFEHRTGVIPDPGPGQVLVKTILLSVDPANRAYMNFDTFNPKMGAGQVLGAFGIAEVLSGDGLDPGTLVFCQPGWQEYAAIDTATAIPVKVRSKLSHHLGVLGLTGMTAYFGMLDIGEPREGETVLVSAAAGATGNVAGQLARIHGARVVGITSSDEKNRYLQDELGFAATVNRKSPTFFDDVKAACPDGVDVFFDNTGGPALDAALQVFNQKSRLVVCGAISTYNTDRPGAALNIQLTQLALLRLKVQGFVVLDDIARWPEAEEKMAGWINAGALKPVEEIIDGLENAPRALIGLLAGENLGKRMVRVAPDPS